MACILSKSLEEIDEMQADEVLLWQHYLSEQPRGWRRLDYHAAQITQAVYTVISSFSSESEKIKLKDCLLKFEDQSSEDADKATIRNIMMIGRMFGKNMAEKIPEIMRKAKEVDSRNSGK